jgi:hypothetical protein
MNRRKFAAPQALVDRQQIEVGFRERIGDLEGVRSALAGVQYLKFA